MVFLYNTECEFDKDSGLINFKKLAWMVPIEAIIKVELIEYTKSEKLVMKISMNDSCTKAILKIYKLPIVTKSSREVEFHCSRMTTGRDFLWNIKRIHHWWNFAKPSGNANNNKELEIKVTTVAK